MYPFAHGYWRRLCLVSLLLFALLPAVDRCQAGEYSDKAALLLRCVRYVQEWPKEKMHAGAPFVIGVMGDDNMADLIREGSRGLSFPGREVVIKTFTAIPEIAGCHVLFVSRSEAARQGSILRQAHSSQVLTFGETDNFVKDGGIIGFALDGERWRYRLNDRARSRADLKFSAPIMEYQMQPDSR